VYKKIPGFSKYCINKNGNLKRIEDNVVVRWHKSNGYKFVKIIDNYGNKISIGQHRALALTFLPKPVETKNFEVNHINGIKDDNRLENLEWVTRSENYKHAIRTGLYPTIKVILTNRLRGSKIYKTH